MKTQIVATLMVLSILSSLAQTFFQPSGQAQKPFNFNGNSPYSSQTKVYGTQNGFKNLTPSRVIETDPFSGQTKIYGTQSGFKNLTPSRVIETDPFSGQTKIYGTQNGFKNLTPSTVIETDPPIR